jgi:hypothetical protein
MSKSRYKLGEGITAFAKSFTEEHARKLRRLVIKHGSHNIAEKEVCIMEAVALVTGQHHTDHPMCVSPVIIDIMQSRNDGEDMTDRKRGRLKRLVPTIISTAPLGQRIDPKDGKAYVVPVTTPEFTAVEKIRKARVRALEQGVRGKTGYRYANDPVELLTPKEFDDLVTELAEMGKFNQGVTDETQPQGQDHAQVTPAG